MLNYNEEYNRWLDSISLTKEEKDELLSIKDDESTKAFRFSTPMEFGTAGLRSAMYMGIGCMNRFTVAQATRGIAALVKASQGEMRGVAIAYDSRNKSKLFAQVSASVLAGAGIKVYIFDDIRPTPELSFAVRKLNALAGINITASHNPKEYNGYKAYWEDGAQISPEQAAVVSAECSKFDVLDVEGIADYSEAVKNGIITVLGNDFDEQYIASVLETSVCGDLVKEMSDSLKVVYTPLHGAGYKLVPEVFSRIGLKNLYTVESQMVPDGNFPTVEKPNPEYAAVFKSGIELANSVGSDLVIATDPDSDRVGVMTRNKDGEFVTITGNQMGALLLDFIITIKKQNKSLSNDAFCVKSIVSTDMVYKIAEMNGVKLHDVLTGFKFIGEVIKNYEAESKESSFLLGFEESYGYLLGTYARDKDAVGASMSILEMTAYYKRKDMTLADALSELYKKYGYYGEKTIDVYMEGLDGIERRRRVMQTLRANPPKSIADVEVRKIGDYISSEITDIMTGEKKSTGQPKSDVLYFTLDSGDKIIIRPSGTEPKIKIYILMNAENPAVLQEKSDKYSNAVKRMTEV